jgi:hypothetical protein
MSPRILYALLCITSGMLAASFVAPWWYVVLVGVANMCLLTALRVNLKDQFLALDLKVDAIVREERPPKLLVVVPDLPKVES